MTLWEPGTRRELQRRFATLTPTGRARWGSMSTPQMIAHLIESFRMASGELLVVPKPGPFRYPPLKHLIIYYLPWPQGAPTAPELLARGPREWAADVNELTTRIDRFAARDIAAAWPDHPAFGAMSGSAWGFLMCRHCDRHLRQFGV